VGADIDHAHPDAAADILAWGEWCIKELGHVGFRFDAIKVIGPLDFARAFIDMAHGAAYRRRVHHNLHDPRSHSIRS
jgi:glycosidase